MDGAAQNGHVDVVEWLHTNRNEGCTTSAMDEADKNRFWDVVDWLGQNRSEGGNVDNMEPPCFYRVLSVHKLVTFG
ncbi:hypothetical protein JG687_00019031 [Phytophthora cactorum]|uniref:Ankyrin repeat-containing domain n=1 Tax=Phytophthora cactorum TaxID=29920 RepID=A0A8T1TL91_9STRA|nr:hypothetical protein JG687_00019031 [Phytophthora cactorum]